VIGDSLLTSILSGHGHIFARGVVASKCNQSESKVKDPRQPIKPPDRRYLLLMRKAIVRRRAGRSLEVCTG
jgi:hypothetical protein